MIKNEKVWETAIIFKTISGSRLYGTATEESDTDIRGVCHQTVESLVGIHGFEQYEAKVPQDITIFGLTKFCQLALQCNPNIVELLFAPTSGDMCLFIGKEWHDLLEIRSAFLSRKARHTFSGYSFAQLKRIESHHKWIVDPPAFAPIPEEFGAVQSSGSYKWSDKEGHSSYQSAQTHWRQYQEWLANRNPTRADLEHKYGYDTKHGMHLARLMVQGIELLSTGFLTLPRPDAEWLLEIRNGLMDYYDIVAWAAEKQAEMVKIEETSPLPWGPDSNIVEDFLIKTNIARLGAVR
jgi:predicted nucleotidyltransferase